MVMQANYTLSLSTNLNVSNIRPTLGSWQLVDLEPAILEFRTRFITRLNNAETLNKTGIYIYEYLVTVYLFVS